MRVGVACGCGMGCVVGVATTSTGCGPLLSLSSISRCVTSVCGCGMGCGYELHRMWTTRITDEFYQTVVDATSVGVACAN